LSRELWLQILACLWWGLAARELISFLALLTALQKRLIDKKLPSILTTATENKLLSDVIAVSIYVCSALAMMVRF
jgi:hypothetical protein